MQTSIRDLQVQTLDERRLMDASAHLAAQVGYRQPDIFRPDLIVGIRSGGFVVAEGMKSTFPEAVLLPITCCRPSTKKKQKSSLFKRMLRKLPDFVTARLRILEHIVLTEVLGRKKTDFVPDKAEVAAIEQYLGRFRGALPPNILIVDDSVDSGATLATVFDLVKSMAGPKAIIKTAVITVTTAHPLIEPDYLLYRYVLCRFPWSFDFKG